MPPNLTSYDHCGPTGQLVSRASIGCGTVNGTGAAYLVAIRVT